MKGLRVLTELHRKPLLAFLPGRERVRWKRVSALGGG